MKIKLSVVLATHNEEKNLSLCLSSVKEIADEIILVDGESSDKTVEIAKSFSARVIQTTNKLNFHINKQMGMDEAKGVLVLQLDADEVVDHQLKTEILEIIAKVAKETSLDQFSPKAWYVSRKNWYLGRFLTKGGQYPDKVIRLYVNGYASLPQKDVHEQITVKGSVGQLNGHLLHYGHPNFSATVHKMNTYTSFEAEKLFDNNTPIGTATFVKYAVFLPCQTFFSIFVRHKGFVDGFSGFVFALISALHHPITLLKLWEKYAKTK
jgi:glycosyltransferase involved in cell wall biosynthesis